MLVELAIGDAYGAGFEYVRDYKFIRQHNNIDGYIKHPRHRRKPGCYTDDTQMSLAIAELIVDQVAWTPVNIADKFVNVFKRERPFRSGYSGAFFKFLKKINNGKEFLENIQSNSDKSGAAMRSAPIGFFPTVDEVIEKSTIQAKITHDTADGVNAAAAAALMTHYFLYDLGNKEDLGSWLKNHVPGLWDELWTGEVGSKGWMSVRAAITAIQRSDTMSKLLLNCTSFSGDVDTVAAIAMAAGSCSKEISQDIPQILFNKLENGEFGRDYLIGLDARLMQFVKS